METVYTPTRLPSKNLPALLASAACVIGIFSLLPLIIAIPQFRLLTGNPIAPVTDTQPPQAVVEPETKTIEVKPLEKPEIEPPLVEVTLTMVERMINAQGTGIGPTAIMTDVRNFLETDPVFEVHDVDKKPAALFQTKPHYPHSQSKTPGKVVVEFVIGPDGKVTRARAVSSTHRDFEQPAIDSIIRSSWRPAFKDDKAVATRVTQTILFKAQ